MVEKVIDDFNHCLLNTGEPTYRHHSHHSFSVPDLSVCDPSLVLGFDWLTHNDGEDGEQAIDVGLEIQRFSGLRALRFSKEKEKET